MSGYGWLKAGDLACSYSRREWRVEAYHGILKRELFDRFEYGTFTEAQKLINEFMNY